MIFTRNATSSLRLVLLGTLIIAVSPTQQLQALSFSPKATQAWIIKHKALCYLAVATPCVAFYARKTIYSVYQALASESSNPEKKPEDTSKKDSTTKKSLLDHVEDCANAFINAEKLISTVISVTKRIID